MSYILYKELWNFIENEEIYSKNTKVSLLIYWITSQIENVVQKVDIFCIHYHKYEQKSYYRFSLKKWIAWMNWEKFK
jgi:hypothetical protein